MIVDNLTKLLDLIIFKNFVKYLDLITKAQPAKKINQK